MVILYSSKMYSFWLNHHHYRIKNNCILSYILTPSLFDITESSVRSLSTLQTDRFSRFQVCLGIKQLICTESSRQAKRKQIMNFLHKISLARFSSNLSVYSVISRSFHSGFTRETLSETKLFLGQYTGGSIDLEKKESGIAHVVLNHPERRNALSGEILLFLSWCLHPCHLWVVGSMMVDLMDVVEELETWEEGVGLILRGAENKSNIFCSGGDLKTVDKIPGIKWPPYSSLYECIVFV